MISIIVTCRQKYFSNLVFFSLESNTVVLKYDLPVIFHLYFLIPFYRSIILFSSSTFVTSICCYLLLIKKKKPACVVHMWPHILAYCPCIHAGPSTARAHGRIENLTVLNPGRSQLQPVVNRRWRTWDLISTFGLLFTSIFRSMSIKMLRVSYEHNYFSL